MNDSQELNFSTNTINHFSKVMVFGKPGSGKSTFALQLHSSLHLPLFHLDRYFFKANWMERDYSEFLNLHQEIINQDKWIIDGNCLQSLESRYSKAQLCVYLNYSNPLCLYRLIKRLRNKNPHILDRAEGCKEKISWKLFSYLWSFEQRVDPLIKRLKNEYPEVYFIEVSNNTDLKKLIQELD